MDNFFKSTPETTENLDYLTYRGKCKGLSEQLGKENPSLTIVRGYYMCP